MNSIRKELTVRLAIGLLVILVVASLLLGRVFNQRIQSDFDKSMLVKATVMAGLISREGRYVEIDFDSERMPEYEETEYFRVAIEGQGQVAESESLEELDFEELEYNPDRYDAFAPIFLDEEIDERSVRSVFLSFKPRFDAEDQEEDPETPAENADLYPIPDGIAREDVRVGLWIARGYEEMDGLLTFIYASLVGVNVLALLGSVMVARMTIAKGLSPVEEINRQVRELNPSEKGNDVMLTHPPEELQPIVDALNDLLNRSWEALARERRFSSAVAHELRTPVAELRMACETGMKWPEDAESVRRLFSDNLEIAQHMERIVSHLLELTRCDNKTSVVVMEEVGIDELVSLCWKRSADVAASSELTLEKRIDPNTRVVSDRAKLEIILQNLVDNAVSYSVTGSVVAIVSIHEDGSVTLSVENQTDNLEAIDMERLFDRFWRKDPSRSGDSHAGLGLSLVKALVELLEIELDVALTAKGVFKVKLTFPSN